MADWFSTNLYNRRIQLAGGKAEEGNGLRYGGNSTDSTLANHRLSISVVSFD